MTPADTSLERLTVWKVGCPHCGDLPPATLSDEFQSRANALGLSCEVEAFPAKDFHLVFAQALETQRVPDVLVICNYGILTGIETKIGTFTGIHTVIASEKLVFVSKTFDSLYRESGGWALLVKGSARHTQAMKMATTKPPVRSDWGEGRSPTSDVSEIRSIAYSAAQAFLHQQVERLWSFLDADHMMVHTIDTESEPRPRPESEVLDIEVARVWGNQRLAFCGVAFTYPTGPNNVGGGYLVVALRREGTKSDFGPWRILFVSDDPITVDQMKDPVPKLSLDLAPGDADPVFSVQITAPENGEYPERKPEDVLEEGDDDRFGFFKWSRESKSTLVAELAEFVSCDVPISSARAIVLRSNLDASQGQVSAGWLWTTGSRWQWRVWSIAGDGTLAFSSWREIDH